MDALLLRIARRRLQQRSAPVLAPVGVLLLRLRQKPDSPVIGDKVTLAVMGQDLSSTTGPCWRGRSIVPIPELRIDIVEPDGRVHALDWSSTSGLFANQAVFEITQPGLHSWTARVGSVSASRTFLGR